MRFQLLTTLTVAVALSTADAAQAERPTEDRATADFTAAGEVKGVYTRDEGHYYHYIIEIALDEIEKGGNLERGDTLYVYSFDRKKNAPPEPSASGHEVPPKKGQRIKAFVKDRRGKHEAIYPNWYDELQPGDSKKSRR
jgi:hypothetical protein